MGREAGCVVCSPISSHLPQKVHLSSTQCAAPMPILPAGVDAGTASHVLPSDAAGGCSSSFATSTSEDKEAHWQCCQFSLDTVRRGGPREATCCTWHQVDCNCQGVQFQGQDSNATEG